MECEKCEDKGFTEEEYGLVMVLCDCEKGNAKRVELMGEMPDDEPISNGDDFRSPTGDDLSHPTTGSGGAGKPTQRKKPKGKKKARAKSS